ncbi:MAG: histidine kinase, partial [Clostridia bacterium]
DQFYLLNTPKLTKGGLLAMRLSENALYQSLGVRGEGFDYYLVDAHHIVLSSSDRSLPKRALPAALQIALEAGTLREIEGNVLCYPEAIGELQVLITYDVSDMRAANARAVSGMLLVVVMAMLTSIALLSLMGRSFSDNIRRILQKLRIMREGQFAQPLTVHTGDELEQIDDSICDLGCNVARLSQSLVDAAQRQKALELRFLQMQINRHFLHNSLSSLRWMAVRKGEDELAELMESLIAFYRVTLSQDDILLLQDEITLVENYVRLENVIHLGDLHFHCDIPETLKTIRVCKMALQPFVENAIHHGKIQGQVLDIWLSAEEMAGSIILRVEDNGHGMTRERVAELQEIFQGKKSGGDSIAIYNTLSRLRGLYGMDVDLSIMVRQGTVIEIMLPLQEE